MRVEWFEDILAWQRARDLARRIYNQFGCSKDYGFKDQIQRAAVSVMNNIAEGFERKSNLEFKQFLYISKGSCGEVRSMLYLAKDVLILDEKNFSELLLETEIISKMLSNFIKKLWLYELYKLEFISTINLLLFWTCKINE